jgi:uncharacterized protein YbjT (DUF2867 family)
LFLVLDSFEIMKITKENKGAKILVTGATGLSGSIVIKEFEARKIPVRALVRDHEKAKKFDSFRHVELYKGDLLQPDSYQDAMDGIEAALLISSAFEKLAETQMSFVDAAKAAGVPFVIKYSGTESGIGFNTQNFIAQTIHEQMEDYLINSGLKWALIRPSQFMQMYLPGAPTGVNKEKNALILPIGRSKLSPVDIEDVAKVVVQMLTQKGHDYRIYEMTGPDAMDMYEATEIISKILGREVKYIDSPLDEYVASLPPHIPPIRVEILKQISMERSKCLDSHIHLGTHKKFGVRPTNFAEFIYKHVAAFA